MRIIVTGVFLYICVKSESIAVITIYPPTPKKNASLDTGYGVAILAYFHKIQ